MDDQSKSRRLYSDREVGAVLKRATELQEKRRQSLAHSLSLEEVEQVAAEIGVEREYLRAAVQELDRHPVGQGGLTLTGGPFAADLERVVAGEVTDDLWEEIVLELRRLTGSVGETSQLGQAREWSDGGEMGQTQVTIRSRGDRTTIRVLKNYQGWAAFVYFMVAFASATATGIALDGKGFSEWVNVSIVGGAVLSGLAAVRAGLIGWTRRQRQKVKVLADYLDQAVAQGAPGAAERRALGEGGQTLAAEVSSEREKERVEVEARRHKASQ